MVQRNLVKMRFNCSLENTEEVIMENKKTKKVTVFTDSQEHQQISTCFDYLSYLVIPDATVLGYLQLPSLEEPEGEFQKLDVVFA